MDSAVWPDSGPTKAPGAPRLAGRAVPFLLLSVVLVAVVLAAALAIVGNRRDVPTADEALIELKTLNASLIAETTGPYSRFGWSHPGPVMFYALAPAYALKGREPGGLYAGAVLLNLLFAGLALRAAYAMGPWPAAAGALAAVVIAFRAQPALASPWNPNLLLLPWFALLVCSGAWAHTGRPGQLASMGVCATWLVQTHVGAAPGVLLLAGTVVALRPRLVLTRSAAMAALAVLLLWSPVVADVVQRGWDSNPARIVHWMINDTQPHVPLRGALQAAAGSLTAFLRPQPVVTPVGWAWKAPDMRVLAWAALAVVAVAAVLRVRRAAVAAAIGGAVCAGAVYTCWSVRGDLVDHLLFWMGGGLPAVVVLGFHTPRAGNARGLCAARLAGFAGFAACAGLALQGLAAAPPRTSQEVADAVRGLAARAGRDLDRAVIDFDEGSWGEAAGIAARLQASGRSLRAGAAFEHMFGRRATAGDAAGLFRILVRRDGTGTELDVRAERGPPHLVAGGLHIWLLDPAGESKGP